MNNKRISVLTGMIFVAFISRLIPHPPDFSPLAAIALFGGAGFASKRAAFLVPFAGLLLSDLVLGFYSITSVVYASFALIVCLGFWTRRNPSAIRIACAAIASAILFFVITNFGEWAIAGLYPKTAAGLAECYAAAIAFFKNTLLSNLLYSALLFGGLKIAEARFIWMLEQPAAV